MHPSRSFIGMDRRFKDSKVTSLERSIFSGRFFFSFSTVSGLQHSRLNSKFKRRLRGSQLADPTNAHPQA